MASTNAKFVIHPSDLASIYVEVYGLDKFTALANDYREKFEADKRPVTENTIKKYNNYEKFPNGHYEWYSEFVLTLTMQLARGAALIAASNV